MGQERRWAEVIETFQAKVVVDMRVAGRCKSGGEMCQQWSQSTLTSI